jgi:hypothetical protein
LTILLAFLAALVLASCNGAHDELIQPEPEPDSPSLKTTRDDVPDSLVQRALESLTSGQSINWQDQTTGNAGSIKPVRTFQIRDGSYCRDYTILFSDNHGGGYMLWHETACRGQNGHWDQVDPTAV